MIFSIKEGLKKAVAIGDRLDDRFRALMTLRNSRYAIYGVLLALFSIAFYMTAWVAEDAFFTFRVIENTLNGYGLVWNIDERVQGYTHPLWFFAQLAVNYLYYNPYYVSLALSYVCMIATICILFKLIYPFGLQSLMIILSLLFSSTFIDYASSGLENPLGYLLVAIFAWIFFKKNDSKYTLICLCLFASFLYMNRPDMIVLIAPPLAYSFFAQKFSFSKKLISLIIGFLPALLWTIFSVIYYGSLVPNTALGKTFLDMPFVEWHIYRTLALLGMSAYGDLLLAPILIGCASMILLYRKFGMRAASVGVGIGLFICYLFSVAGDYMAYRFLSVPMVLSVCTIAYLLRDQRNAKIGLLILTIFVISIHQLRFTLFSPSDSKGRFDRYILDSRHHVASKHLRSVLNSGLNTGWIADGLLLAEALTNQNIKIAWTLHDMPYPLNETEPATVLSGGGNSMLIHNVICIGGELPYAAGTQYHWIERSSTPSLDSGL